MIRLDFRLSDLPPLQYLGIRATAIAEITVLLGLLIAIDIFAGSGNRFMDVQPHPFWIVVLLIAAQYGLLNGLVAVLAASAALLLFNVPPLAPGEDVLGQATRLAFNPALWIVGALLVGGLAERHIQRTKDLAHALKVADCETDILRQSVERLAHVNEGLENRVAGQLTTFAGLYEAAKAVERETPGEVLIGAARLVRSALNAKEFSVFLFNDGVLEAALCEGWAQDSKRARRFRAGSPLFDYVVVRRSTMHVAMEAGEVILARQGVLAGPILDPNTRGVRGMLKIERLAFEDFTPTAVHNFQVLCDWLGAALSRAEGLQSARATSLLSEDGTLLSRRMLSRIEDLLTRLAKREGFALTALDLDVENPTEKTRAALPKLIAAAAVQALRGTDLAFESRDGRGCCILLPGASEAEARAAATRFQFAIEARLAQGNLDADLRVTVRLLNSGHSGSENIPGKAVA